MRRESEDDDDDDTLIAYMGRAGAGAGGENRSDPMAKARRIVESNHHFRLS